jgi:hypothetical protein
MSVIPKFSPGDPVTTSFPHGKGRIVTAKAGSTTVRYLVRIDDGSRGGRLLAFCGESNLHAPSSSDSDFGLGVKVRLKSAGPRSRLGVVSGLEAGKVVVLFPGKPRQIYAPEDLLLVPHQPA